MACVRAYNMYYHSFFLPTTTTILSCVFISFFIFTSNYSRPSAARGRFNFSWCALEPGAERIELRALNRRGERERFRIEILDRLNACDVHCYVGASGWPMCRSVTFALGPRSATCAAVSAASQLFCRPLASAACPQPITGHRIIRIFLVPLRVGGERRNKRNDTCFGSNEKSK